MDINISSDHNPCTLRSEKARTKRNNSCCSTQTHKVKIPNGLRELHSFQGNNFIVILCKSLTGQQLARTRHMRGPQAMHAPQQQSTHKKKHQQLLQHANSRG
jgi:hypothetical protein